MSSISPEAQAALINAGILAIFKLWEMISQMNAPGTIPSWEEIADKNALLQAKIDAEK